MKAAIYRPSSENPLGEAIWCRMLADYLTGLGERYKLGHPVEQAKKKAWKHMARNMRDAGLVNEDVEGMKAAVGHELEDEPEDLYKFDGIPRGEVEDVSLGADADSGDSTDGADTDEADKRIAAALDRIHEEKK